VQAGQSRQHGQLVLDVVDCPGARQRMLQMFIGVVQRQS
jgi:hypothetical protein